MLVRWLGAFRTQGTISEAIDYEMGPSVALRCAELIKKGAASEIDRGVGLLVRNSALVRKFRSDIYSVPDGRRLRQTQPEDDSYSSHTEAWVRPDYIGIVIKSRSHLHRTIQQKTLLAVAQAATRHNLPVFRLRNNGTLEEVVLKLR
jgi:hypothetical protein